MNWQVRKATVSIADKYFFSLPFLASARLYPFKSKYPQILATNLVRPCRKIEEEGGTTTSSSAPPVELVVEDGYFLFFSLEKAPS
jgi:hypothetical protein